MSNTLLKQNLQSSIDKIDKDEHYLSSNIEELFTQYLSQVKKQIPSIRHICLSFANDYAEEFDTYIGIYLSNCTLNIDPIEFGSDYEKFASKIEGKDFYSEHWAFPSFHSLLYSHSAQSAIQNEDIKSSLLELSRIINNQKFINAMGTFYEADCFSVIYNFDTQSIYRIQN